MADETKSSSFNPLSAGRSLFDEFKSFAFKGNVVDLAVGVIIGTAFGGLVTSLVKNIIMPAIALFTWSKTGYEKWEVAYDGKTVPVGLFVGDVLNFLVVALVLFIFIKKFLGWLMKSRKEEVKAPPPLTKDQELLTEIRDLLLSKSQP
ncbi:large conductance mechanosensitive channel protein MscL [Planctomicrobium piriforme]|uniref:Large-conductance mechanosensitive channel n=1 Tax=Planctomicrobium piriforme TaxID=1576369 RepID=A0A1I3SYU4_9PLAN|nr:large conductance mechanosensitive channel protein MscL [Planctomicrobium piriforme]SFJ63392.1 large conductance mechanosensitive channel [Planctomicrobium piriforme]